MNLASRDGLKRESLREEAEDIVYRGNVFLDATRPLPLSDSVAQIEAGNPCSTLQTTQFLIWVCLCATDQIY